MSLPSPQEIWLIIVLYHTPNNRVRKVSNTALQYIKKIVLPQAVSKSRGTEDKEKDEGSLSTLIVLIEGWEISSMKAT